jgi:hypothetical protein
MQKIPGIGPIVFINPNAALKAAEEANAGKIASISAEDFEIKAFNVPSLENAEIPEKFPDCCAGHQSLYTSLKEDFNRFPDCCINHRRLFKVNWFDKSYYLYVPTKVMNSYVFTIDCIKQNMNQADWAKRIKDYIDITIKSFGQLPSGFGPPVGLSHYISLVKNNLASIDDLSAEKHAAIVDMFSDQASKTTTTEYDLELLIQIYKEWLRIFPFDIPYLASAKQHFQGSTPVFKGPGETNMYTGITAVGMKSKKEMLEFVKDATLAIITTLNAANLFERGALTDTAAAELKLLTANRKVEIEQLKLSKNADASGYLKILKKWLKGEKKFVSELRIKAGGTTYDEQFRQCLTDAVSQFQRNSINEPCITNILNGGKGKETLVRYAFKNFLSARFPDATVVAEEEMGNGYMDLTFYQPLLSRKVVEFKGWWNYDKKDIAFQVSKYLTDFEHEGYILMINDQAKDIAPAYKKLLLSENMNFIPGSWAEHSIANGRFTYYSSLHQFGITSKKIYHIIFNVRPIGTK